MSTVLVERSFAEPVVFEELQALEEKGASCLEAHGVRFLRTYLGRDRRRMACLYEAPDAESVRVAETQAGLPFDRVFSVNVLRHPGDEPRDEVVVVERVLHVPMDPGTLAARVASSAWCFQEWSCRIVWTYLSLDGRRSVCVFAAPDAESVRQAQRTGELPFERAWAAAVYEPPAG